LFFGDKNKACNKTNHIRAINLHTKDIRGQNMSIERGLRKIYENNILTCFVFILRFLFNMVRAFCKVEQ
jgi:hypothetical protein